MAEHYLALAISKVIPIPGASKENRCQKPGKPVKISTYSADLSPASCGFPLKIQSKKISVSLLIKLVLIICFYLHLTYYYL